MDGWSPVGFFQTLVCFSWCDLGQTHFSLSVGSFCLTFLFLFKWKTFFSTFYFFPGNLIKLEANTDEYLSRLFAVLKYVWGQLRKVCQEIGAKLRLDQPNFRNVSQSLGYLSFFSTKEKQMNNNFVTIKDWF